MSMTRITSSLIYLTLLLAIASPVKAQLYQPFIDPGKFNHDLQFFAPTEVEEFGGERIGKTGWYGTYDRMYMYVSRSKHEASRTIMDHTWGNRLDIGYMTEEDHGWSFNSWHIDGPNASNVLRVQRINQYEAPTAAGGGGGGAGTVTPVIPAINRNDPFTNERTYDVTQSLNNADLTSFEINKVFRLDPFHRGAIMEPFFGARYIKFIDFTRHDTYDRMTSLGVAVPLAPPPDINTATVERLTSVTSEIDNHMLGGQLGFRIHNQHDKWLLSGECRAFALQNFQAYSSQTDIVVTRYGGATLGADPTTTTFAKTNAYAHGAEFAFGAEIRAEAAYSVTRDISLRTGFSFMEIGKGVARGTDYRDTTGDVTLVGVSFGVTVNR